MQKTRFLEVTFQLILITFTATVELPSSIVRLAYLHLSVCFCNVILWECWLQIWRNRLCGFSLFAAWSVGVSVLVIQKNSLLRQTTPHSFKEFTCWENMPRRSWRRSRRRRLQSTSLRPGGSSTLRATRGPATWRVRQLSLTDVGRGQCFMALTQVFVLQCCPCSPHSEKPLWPIWTQRVWPHCWKPSEQKLEWRLEMSEVWRFTLCVCLTDQPTSWRSGRIWRSLVSVWRFQRVNQIHVCPSSSVSFLISLLLIKSKKSSESFRCRW